MINGTKLAEVCERVRMSRSEFNGSEDREKDHESVMFWLGSADFAACATRNIISVTSARHRGRYPNHQLPLKMQARTGKDAQCRDGGKISTSEELRRITSSCSAGGACTIGLDGVVGQYLRIPFRGGGGLVFRSPTGCI